MWFSHCNNNFYGDVKKVTFDKKKISFKRISLTSKYTLYWEDVKLCGTKFQDREFVLYSDVRIGEKLPGFTYETLKDHPAFQEENGMIFCKIPGRYLVEGNGTKMIFDVIFQEIEFEDEYLYGTKGVYNTWTYDMLDADMRTFTMEKIEEIPYENRDAYTIIRHIMSSMSSVNSDSALICGRWDNRYEDGTRPNVWTSTNEIFREWSLKRTPVKYGQCWVFSECFTCIMRFLGLPARTIFAQNTHLNRSLSGYIELYNDNTDKSEPDTDEFYRLIDPLLFFFDDNKSDPWENCAFYNSRDTIWNIHYWNEVFINGAWECIDVTPFVESKYSPGDNLKIMGPCKMSSFQDLLDLKFDFEVFNYGINSPIRYWVKNSFVIDDEVKIIIYVQDIIYPFHPSESIGPNTVNLNRSFKKIRISTDIVNFTQNDMTFRYIVPFNRLKPFLNRKSPIEMTKSGDRILVSFEDSDDIYYIQQVALDINGNIENVKLQICKLEDIEIIKFTLRVKYISFLVIRESEYWTEIIRMR